MAPGWEEFCLDPKLVSPAQTRAGFVLSSERERMERPHHLQTGNTSNSSKLMGIVIVAGIHVLAIIALVAALASGQIMKQIRDIQGFGRPPRKCRPRRRRRRRRIWRSRRRRSPSFRNSACSRKRRRRFRPRWPRRRRRPRPPLRRPRRPNSGRSSVRIRIPPYPTISQRLGEQGTSHAAGRDFDRRQRHGMQSHQVLRFGAPGHRRLRLCAGALEMAAPDVGRQAGRRQHGRGPLSGILKTLSNNQFICLFTE